MCHRKQSSEAIQPLSKMSMSSHSFKCRHSLTQFFLFHMKLTFGCQIAKDDIACDQQILTILHEHNLTIGQIGRTQRWHWNGHVAELLVNHRYNKINNE